MDDFFGELGPAWPQLVIRIDTRGRVDLGHVGAFLQQLDKVIRRPPAQMKPFRRSSGRSVRAEIISIESGSIQIKIAVISLAISAASFAVQIVEALKSDAQAARVTQTLLNSDNAVSITVMGDDNSITIHPEDVQVANAENRPRKLFRGSVPAPEPVIEVLTGPQTGIIHKMGGATWIVLDNRPGLSLEIADQRKGDVEPLIENLRYVLDGEAHIGRDGARSYFLMDKAILLE